MIVYRLAKTKYKLDLSGKGAELNGGRWNSIGFAILYTSNNRALCTTEVAVHLPFGVLPTDYHLITIRIPEKSPIQTIQAANLLPTWRTFETTKQTYTKQIGDQFIKDDKALILKVPSAMIQGEWNFLINPVHPLFKKVKIIKTEAFNFDPRLLSKGD